MVDQVQTEAAEWHSGPVLEPALEAFRHIGVEEIAIALALLVILQLWIELRAIKRHTSGASSGSAFLQVQGRRLTAAAEPEPEAVTAAKGESFHGP